MAILSSWQAGSALLALWLLLATALPAAAADEASEHGVKAAYLYKFADYVEWPAQAFETADSPFVIGVIGADALADELAGIVRGRRIGERPVIVRRLQDDDPLTGLHMLYVGFADPERLSAVLQAIGGQPTLTVTSTDGRPPTGSVISFVMVDKRIRFDVALPPADRQQLKISSLLLAVARHVES